MACVFACAQCGFFSGMGVKVNSVSLVVCRQTRWNGVDRTLPSRCPASATRLPAAWFAMGGHQQAGADWLPASKPLSITRTSRIKGPAAAAVLLLRLLFSQEATSTVQAVALAHRGCFEASTDAHASAATCTLSLIATYGDVPTSLQCFRTFCGDLAVPTEPTYGPRSFAVSGPTSWNSLPQLYRDANQTLGQFQRRLKTSLFRLAYRRDLTAHS